LACREILNLPRILSRLILYQVTTTFLMALVAVTGLLVVLGALFEGPKTGLDPLSVLQLIPYIIAPSLPYIIPACLLFACTSVFSTMSGSNEIIAVKAAGIDAMRLVRPIVTLSFFVAIGTVVLSDKVIPWCRAQLRTSLVGDMEKTLFTYLRQKNCITGPNFPYELYVSDIDGTRLIQPIIKHKRETAGYDMVLQAREATLSIVPSTEVVGQAVIEMRLVDGALSTEPGNSAYFRDRTERIPLPDLIKGDRLAVDDQDFDGLDKQAAMYRHEAEKAKYEAAIVMGSAILQGDPASAAWPAQPILDKIEVADSMAYRAACEIDVGHSVCDPRLPGEYLLSSARRAPRVLRLLFADHHDLLSDDAPHVQLPQRERKRDVRGPLASLAAHRLRGNSLYPKSDSELRSRNELAPREFSSLRGKSVSSSYLPATAGSSGSAFM
jgi:lipopolysaccharide export LptBFGC system permease protein LptF